MNKLNLKQRLQQGHPAVLAIFILLATFCTYTSMFAFRKPFAAATFADGPGIWGLDYKSFLVIAQILGYMLSKFIGIKVVAEMDSRKRALAILVLIGLAELALLGFAAVPPPWNIVFMFLNGMPLGMIWGLVFSFVEGRKLTEVIGLGLCASFIFASGFVKDIGKMLLSAGVGEFWMPFLTGALFALPLVFFAWMLQQVPPPSAEDEALRTHRQPMDAAQRWGYFVQFAAGLVLLVAIYTMITAYRDFRDNFLADIWVDLQGADNAINFSTTETPVSVAVLAFLMLIVLVKNNLHALIANHLAILAGLLTVGIATWGHQAGWVGDYAWIILTGFGTYVGYIPFNSILFDRLIATFRQAGNVGFLIYLADAFAYVGSVSILLYKNVFAPDLSWVQFFTQISYVLALLGGVGVLLSMGYFWGKGKKFGVRG